MDPPPRSFSGRHMGHVSCIYLVMAIATCPQVWLEIGCPGSLHVWHTYIVTFGLGLFCCALAVSGCLKPVSSRPTWENDASSDEAVL